jgi:hypothetical protein
VASGKYRKTRIFQLQQGDRVIEGDQALKEYITSYYKDLFGQPKPRSFSLDESRVEDIEQVSQEENDLLIRPFTMDEVWEAIFQMEHNKALGSDGFPVEFYQSCWKIIKNNIMARFREFHNGHLPLYRLNFGTIILLPKCKEAATIQQYRPICLLNISFKIFTKVATNRISHIATKVISPTQTTFMSGRNIMEGVIVLHKTIYEMHRKKQDGLIFKFDFEKAYNKINWSFVQQTLRMKGFLTIWCRWIASFMEGDHVGVKINDQVGSNFQTKKGVRQGDPLSPIFFNIVVDMLAILIKRAKEEG